MFYNKASLNCATDKNLSKPGLARSSSYKKTRSNKIESYRCDTPDQGGGKPGIKYSRKTSSQSSSNPRPKSVLKAHVFQCPYSCIPSKTSPSAKPASFPNRSRSQSKYRPIDLKQGIFSIKQSAVKHKILEPQFKSISKNWKSEVRSPSVLTESKNENNRPCTNNANINDPLLQTTIISDGKTEEMKPWQIYLRELEKN